jgi:tRNA A22 N-methylase
MLNWEGVRHCVESNSFRLGSERLLRDKDSSHQWLTVQRGQAPEKLHILLLHCVPHICEIRELLRTRKLLSFPFHGLEVV